MGLRALPQRDTEAKSLANPWSEGSGRLSKLKQDVAKLISGEFRVKTFTLENKRTWKSDGSQSGVDVDSSMMLMSMS